MMIWHSIPTTWHRACPQSGWTRSTLQRSCISTMNRHGILPTRLGVLLNVSLLSNIARIAFRRWHAARAEGETSYRSFSAVAIGRHAWDRVGGFDTRYPFAYEDADFVRRAMGHDVQIRGMSTSIVHLHSQTAGRFITAVLPVATWSALEYLTKWFGKRTLHRWLLLAALGVRAPIAVVTMSQPGRHTRAVIRGAKALMMDEQPSLPDWESIKCERHQ